MKGYIQCDSSVTKEPGFINFQNEVNRLLEMAPSDSSPKVEITKKDGLWVIDISVRFSRGHIALTRQGKSLGKLSHEVLRELEDKIRMWQTQRNIELFHFDKFSEYDFFSTAHGSANKQKLNFSVLVVEDDPAASSVLESMLIHFGCQVTVANEPQDAISLVLKNGYDLIILDWNLPHLTGSEFMETVDSVLKNRKQNSNKLTPVVICSSLPFAEIELPSVSQFYFIDHWHKGLPFSSVIHSFEKTIEKLVQRKGA